MENHLYKRDQWKIIPVVLLYKKNRMNVYEL